MSKDRKGHSVSVDNLVGMDKRRIWGRDEQGGQHSLSPLVTSWGTRGHKQLETQAHHPQTKILDIRAAHYNTHADYIIWATQQPNQLSRAHIYSFHFLCKETGSEVE